MRGNDLGIDARKKLTSTQITEVSRWRSREEELSVVHRPHRGRAAGQTRPAFWMSSSRPTRTSSIELVKVSEAAPLAGGDRVRSDQRREVPRRLVTRRQGP